MSLDFMVLGKDGSPEKTVSIGVDLHHEFVTTAASRGLASFVVFKDYYEDVEVAVQHLPDLFEQILTLRSQTGSSALKSFLDDLRDLTAYAIDQQAPLCAIAD
jgi:hypothetical protein